MTDTPHDDGARDSERLYLLDFLELTLGKDGSIEIGLADLKVTEVSVEVDSADKEKDLCPSRGRDRRNGVKAVGDIGERQAKGKIAGEAVDFLEDVSEDSKLGNTSVLEFDGAVTIEFVLRSRQLEGIKVTRGGDDTNLVLEHVEGRGGRGLLGSRSECRSTGKEGEGSNDLHGSCELSDMREALVA